ncbi:MAG TPA: phosphate acyltransferase PlsX, partial [Dactylosporangium sp.]|nr:phosphate acyltransferase PlsX [Dactylosporangium sp.]
RPGLAAQLPTPNGAVLLLDVGVTLDATMLELVQHAVLGTAFAAVALGLERPRVGLLSIGSEPGKGDRLRRAVSIALSDVPLPAGGRYIGLVEGHDVPRGGPADVVVTDGFTGNVLLKGIEGALSGMHHNAGTAAKHEAAAVLLGVAGDVVVCHGSAGGSEVADGIALAARLHRGRITPAVASLADDLLTELSSAGGLTIRDAMGERS